MTYNNVLTVRNFNSEGRPVASWKELSVDRPTPLRKSPDAPIPYPFEALGEVLGPAAEDLFRVIKCPRDVVGQSLLATVMLLAQAHRDVEIDGRVSPCSAFFMTVAESGERKSSIDSVVLKDIVELEKELSTIYRNDKIIYDKTRKIYDRKVNALYKNFKSENPTSLDAEIKALGPAPRHPTPFLLLVQEPTYEAMIQLYQKGCTHLGLFSDEGGRMIGGFGMNQDNLLKTLTGLSEAWDGKPISRVRVGDGFDKMYGKRLSMHLLMQPVVAGKLLSSEIAMAQGFMARTLITTSDGLAGSRPYVSENPSTISSVCKVYARVQEILKLPISVSDDGNRELWCKSLQLSEGARSLFLDFYSEVETELGPLGRFASIKAFGSKAAEHALRLAGGLTFFDSQWHFEIPAEIMANAITLLRFYLHEHLRIMDFQIMRPELEKAEKLLAYCHRKNLKKIGLTEILQSGPQRTRVTESAHEAIDILIAYGWFKPIEKGIWGVVDEQ